MPPPTQIVFVGNHRWSTFAIFNTNAYPDEVKSIVSACGSRLALLSLHTASLSLAIRRDREEFLKSLKRQREDMERALTGHPELTCIAMYDGLAYLAEMHSCLNALKSFLDLYAKLVGKLMHPLNEWAFRKASVDGTKIAGGRFVNSLQNCAKESVGSKLATLTASESRGWITAAVSYRDQLSHRSDLDDMTHMRLPLYSKPPHFQELEIVDPKMPNGEPVEEYFGELLQRLTAYVRQSIVLAPNIDQNGIYPDRFGR